MSVALDAYLHGALALASFVIGLKFLKYWRLSRDRFFLWFSSAFWVFAFGWTIRAFAARPDDQLYYVYVPRLLAFLLIVAAIYDKNRRQDR